MAPVSLPPGFRFHPTDEELAAYYLDRKITGRKIELEIIPEIDLYKCEPWDLPGMYHINYVLYIIDLIFDFTLFFWGCVCVCCTAFYDLFEPDKKYSPRTIVIIKTSHFHSFLKITSIFYNVNHI